MAISICKEAPTQVTRNLKRNIWYIIIDISKDGENYALLEETSLMFLESIFSMSCIATLIISSALFLLFWYGIVLLAYYCLLITTIGCSHYGACICSRIQLTCCRPLISEHCYKFFGSSARLVDTSVFLLGWYDYTWGRKTIFTDLKYLASLN